MDPLFCHRLGHVDEQHLRVIDIINQFDEVLMQPQGSSADEIEAVFGELASYAESTFRTKKH